jgi:hypothetical protein
MASSLLMQMSKILDLHQIWRAGRRVLPISCVMLMPLPTLTQHSPFSASNKTKDGFNAAALVH